MESVVGVFVDNSSNPQPLTIQAQQLPQEKLVVPAYAQGVFPIIAPIRPKFTITTNGSVNVLVIFTNIPLGVGVWFTQAPAVPTTPTNFTVAVGGTAVNPWDTLHVTGGGFIYNPVAATEDLFVDLVNSAGTAEPGVNGTTVGLIPGGSLPIPTGFISVSVNAVTAGHAFVAVGLGVR